MTPRQMVENCGPSCANCRHRTGVGFLDFLEPEIAFMERFRRAHRAANAGALLIAQQQQERSLFTLYSGLAIKCRTLSDGKRQIMRLYMPGDLIGLETLYTKTCAYSVEAITDVTCCMFEAERWPELLERPRLVERICAMQALDQQRAETRLSAIASQSAIGNLCNFMAETFVQLRRRRLARGMSFLLPLGSQQLADVLGLTPACAERSRRFANSASCVWRMTGSTSTTWLA